MDVKIVLNGITELEQKIEKTQKILSDLKDIVNEINDSQVTITLKPS
jgi:cell division protein FtsL